MDWPTTIEGWTAIAANIATVAGALAIPWVVSVKLSASIYYQRRQAIAQESAIQQARGEPIDAKNAVLNSVFLWAERRAKFVRGFSPEQFAKLPRKERYDYILWVSRLIAGLDIVVMEDGASADSKLKIAHTIAEHAPALVAGWGPFKRIRYPVSPEMRALINATLTKSRA